MTDAEYEELKYAAIAMGEKPVRLSDDGRALLMWGIDDPWNPRDSDRDAFRLAVRCGICIEFTSCVDDAPVVYCGLDYQRRDWPMTPNFPDPFKATRLAITRAAAEIGKQMGGGDV